MKKSEKTKLKEKIMERLSEIKDPELGYSIVDLGYVNEIQLKNGKKVVIKLVLTTPLCPYGGLIFEMVEKAVRKVEGIKDVEVEYDWENPWSIEKIKPRIRKELGL